MAERLGDAVLDLRTDDTAFDRGIDRAHGRARGLERQFAQTAERVKRSMLVVGAAMAAAAGGLGVSIKASAERMDELTKAAQGIGIGVEQLSALAHAADLSGVSLQGLSVGVGMLSRNMLALAEGSSTEATRAFETLGIAVANADGTLRSAQDVMLEVADRFVEMEDGTEKTATAMLIFGRSGKDLIPLLNQGSAGIRIMTEEARALGLTFDEETGRQAEEFNDTLLRINRVGRGFTTQLTAELLPSLVDVAHAFEETARDGDMFKDLIELLAGAFRVVSEQAILLAADIRAIKAEFAGLAEAASLAAELDFEGAWAAYRTGVQEAVRISDEARARINAMWAAAAGLDRPGPGDDPGGVEQMIRELKAAPRAAGRPATGTAGVTASASTIESATRAVRDLNTGIAETTRLGSDMQSAVGGALGVLIDGIRQGDGALRSLGAALDRLADRLLDIALDQTVNALFNNIALAFHPLLRPGGPPLDLAAMAGGAPRFQHGGSFTVGGLPGIDRNLVAFRASRGERVDVTPAGRLPGAAGVEVNVINQAGGEVSRRDRTGADGRSIVDIVIGAVRDDVARGGFDEAMRMRFGARPATGRLSGGS